MEAEIESRSSSSIAMKDEQLENIRCLHAGLVAKRTTLDQLIWQAPIIALTAQAFLMTIAFSSSNSRLYRIASGVIAMLIGLLSWQLFLRHTRLEREATQQLEALELKHFGQTVHSRPGTSWRVSGWRSRWIWAACLVLVSLTGLLPLIDLMFHWTL
jgi:hypothetical protein